MTPDEVIALRQLWAKHNYGPTLPQATVLAEHDWVSYVLAMADAVPAEENLAFPTEQDCRWAWPKGVCVVFDEPLDLHHTIVSMQTEDKLVKVPAHGEVDRTAGLAIMRLQPIPSQLPDGTPVEDILARPIMWIGTDPTDIITTHWIPGHGMMPSATGKLSQSSRLLLSIVIALGHRLTRLAEPAGARPERRRVERELPELRVLKLSTGASVSRAEGTGTVEWSHRWMVRGHWHTVAHGPKKALRRVQWYDPYVKGPEDKPLDVRTTIWRTGQPD